MLQQQSHGMRMLPKLQRNKKQRRKVKHTPTAATRGTPARP